MGKSAWWEFHRFNKALLFSQLATKLHINDSNPKTIHNTKPKNFPLGRYKRNNNALRYDSILYIYISTGLCVQRVRASPHSPDAHSPPLIVVVVLQLQLLPSSSQTSSKYWTQCCQCWSAFHSSLLSVNELFQFYCSVLTIVKRQKMQKTMRRRLCFFLLRSAKRYFFWSTLHFKWNVTKCGKVLF